MIFIDESGDWGFGKGASQYSTIAGVVAEDPKPITNYVRHFKRRAGKGKLDELHASSMKLSKKEKFLTGLVEHDFSIIAITIKKANVKKHLRDKPNLLFNYQAGLLLIPCLSMLEAAEVVF